MTNKVPKTQEELHDFYTKIIQYEMEAMVRLICIVNLRRECYDCIVKIVAAEMHGFIVGQEELFNNDFEQFMRQVVIFAKETAERELKKDCSLGENAKELIAEFKMKELQHEAKS